MKKIINHPETGITALGLITSVGHDVKTACASIRAGMKRPKKLDHFYTPAQRRFEEWEEGLVTGHPVLKGDYDRGTERMGFFLASALDDLYRYGELDHDAFPQIPLYLALPAKERRGVTSGEVISLIREHPDLFPWVSEKIEPCGRGHAGMIFAICDAIEAIGSGRCERAVVAGVDTLIGFNDLSWFHQKGRLKTDRNPDGFIPGEAAAAILIESLSAAGKRGANMEAVIEKVATGYEKAPLLSGKRATGDGLAQVVNALLETEDAEDLAAAAIITDLNGEPYRFDEMALVDTKVMNRIRGEKKMICPARSIGDTGAASAGVAICTAVRGMVRGGLQSRQSDGPGNGLILSSSDSGGRGALYIVPPAGLPRPSASGGSADGQTFEKFDKQVVQV